MQLIPQMNASLRQLYALGNDRLWFALAVLVSLLVAGELISRLLLAMAPTVEYLTRL